jgi:hypothetical protein
VSGDTAGDGARRLLGDRRRHVRARASPTGSGPRPRRAGGRRRRCGCARPPTSPAATAARWCEDGFVWDYSGHFFHFKRPAIEAWLRARMDGEVRTVHQAELDPGRRRRRRLPVPEEHPPAAQGPVHRLPGRSVLPRRGQGRGDAGLVQGDAVPPLRPRHRRGFLIPYNTKLYATDLDRLDRDAMGRFFPHADVADIVRNMRAADNASYNATFTYPARGAMEYVRALLRDLPADTVALATPVTAIDLRPAWRRRRAARRLRPAGVVGAAAGAARAVRAAGRARRVHRQPRAGVEPRLRSQGATDVHWMYFPDPARSFYRVGWYDNIMGGDRMSLYVEIGLPSRPTTARRRRRWRCAIGCWPTCAPRASSPITSWSRATP